MKESRFLLGLKQADGTVIYVKGMSGEEVERAFTYYEAQDYKSLAYARTTRNIYESLKDFDVYRVNIEIYNTEPTREEERQKKIEEENKVEAEVVEPEVVPEEKEKVEEPVEDTKEVDVKDKEASNEEKIEEETKEENTEIIEENKVEEKEEGATNEFNTETREVPSEPNEGHESETSLP